MNTTITIAALITAYEIIKAILDYKAKKLESEKSEKKEVK